MEPKISKEVREFLESDKSMYENSIAIIDKVLQGDISTRVLSAFDFLSAFDGEQIQIIAEDVIDRRLSLEELTELISCATENGSWYYGLYNVIVDTLNDVISEEEFAEVERRREEEQAKIVVNRSEVNPDEDF